MRRVIAEQRIARKTLGNQLHVRVGEENMAMLIHKFLPRVLESREAINLHDWHVWQEDIKLFQKEENLLLSKNKFSFNIHVWKYHHNVFFIDFFLFSFI